MGLLFDQSGLLLGLGLGAGCPEAHGCMGETWRIPEQNEVYIKKEEVGNGHRVGNS